MHQASLALSLSRFGARAPVAADDDFLARLYASTRPDLYGNGGADPAFAAALVAMQERLQAAGYLRQFPAAQYLLLSQQGRPAGRIVVDIGKTALRLVDIALLPEARGHGLGSAVIRALQDFAAANGLAVTLAVHHSNPDAARLYRALGFSVTSSDAAAEQMRWRA
ncbi:MAG: GNAT family N-acetyltransferase [Telluria sp.]